MAHEGHPGIVRMKQRCREAIWWPKLDSYIEAHVQHCEACAVSNKANQPHPPPVQPIKWPERPWQKIQLDIFGEIKVAPFNQRFLVVIHDMHSKWPEIASTSTVTSSTIIHILNDLFTRWGLPDTLITDNGPQFTSHEFQSYLQSLGIEHHFTARYNPQCTGAVERFNRVIKNGLKAGLAEGRNLKDIIHIILQSYRATPHALTRQTPAELMIGRKLRLPLEKLTPYAPVPQKIIDKADDIAKRQNKTKQYADRRRRAKHPRLKPGDYIRLKRPFQQHKLSPALSEPKQIQQQIGPSTYRLTDGTVWNARRCVPSNQTSDSLGTDLPFRTFDDGPAAEPQPVLDGGRPLRICRPPGYLRDYIK